jgi:hypothetical protein
MWDQPLQILLSLFVYCSYAQCCRHNYHREELCRHSPLRRRITIAYQSNLPSATIHVPKPR